MNTDYLLINDRIEHLKAAINNTHKEHFVRLIEQCRLYEGEQLSTEHPPTSITYMGLAAANLSLAYRLTGQEHYLEEAKRWLFTAVGYDVWGFGFLVDVDLSASWLLYGLGLSYDWIKEDLTPEEQQLVLNKLILQGNKMFDYGEDNKGNCWSTDYWQNHNWINYTGLLTTAYAIRSEYAGAEQWITTIKENFKKVFDYLPEDGSNYEGTVYWRYAMKFFLTSAELIHKDGGPNYFESAFLKNTFYFKLYQTAPNWEENINFGDTHDRRSSHSVCAYYKIASAHQNEHAQWLAELVRTQFLFREAYQSKVFPGILPEAFLEFLWYDPTIAPKKPDALPLNRFFPDLGLVVMRSGWDSNATHLSFKASPPGGHKQWKLSWELNKKYNWRTRSLTHYHVDFNHFNLIHKGASLAIDEGYNRTSKAEIHNLITVDGTGCVGEKIWEEGDLSDPVLFDLNCKGIHNVWRDVPESAVANIEAFSETDGYVYAVGESSKMYYPEMQLKRNARHLINSQLGYIILLDELESDLEHTYTWRMHSERYATKISEQQYEIRNGAGALNIFPLFPEVKTMHIDETLVEEVMTPQRPDDIRRISLKTLKIENTNKAKNTCFLNVLQPKDGLKNIKKGKLILEKIQGDTFQGVQISSEKHTEIFLYSEQNQINYKGKSYRAKWISIVMDSNGKQTQATQYT